MKIVLALICLVTSVHFFGGGIHFPEIGKDLYYTVEQGQVVDADYIEKVLDYEDRGLIREFYQHELEMREVDSEVKEVAKGTIFGLYRAHIKELIDFMRKNNLKIAPGQYMFNQTWGFRDGKFVINKFIGQNEIEVFKFEKK